MMWSLKLVLHRLRANLKANITLIVQIALGAALLFSSLSIEESCIGQQKQNQDTMANLAVTISENGEDAHETITIEDYQAVKTALADAPFEVIYAVETGMYAQDERISILLVSDNYGPWMLHEEGVGENYAMGQKAAEKLLPSEKNISAAPGLYDAEHQLLFGHPLKDYQVLTLGTITQTARSQQVGIQSNTDYSYANTVFVPLGAWTADNDAVGTAYIYLVPHDDAVPMMDTFCEQAVTALKVVHPSLQVMYQNDFLALQSQANELIRNAELFRTIALVMLAILSFEIIGHFMLIVFRRQKSYAISRMCGAGALQLMLELFLEVGGMALMGAWIGMIPALAILPQIGNGLYVPHGTLGAALAVTALLLGLSLLVTLFCVPAIAATAPVDTLRNSNE